ncbi:alpha/beta-hydrolase [Eremomyces bilateralis CBS 781.70]|uniref:Alpha/beta-hydrolase n=1 Tax=Eremomyces bilateralis CBS 781.70 TaxID=1392243 RepID=A0A6G1G3J1_9PEZI|nr:alpha/beta-hydrolase [Eremomyces bilateralis CBS 781.70]KAF1812552.1 alpha/beta-hydrolase [Eremomyces bilateralis CBS 781.70]
MIDHVLGRPSVKYRKYEVLAAVCFWSLFLYKGGPHGPPVIRRISNYLTPRITAYRTVVLTLLYLYTCRNLAPLAGLESPEPLANLYSRSYFRATWVTTALDAGFWTAMRIRRKWLRDSLSMVFSVYYLICAQQADEKVRKVRGALTLDHLRVSWNKSQTPYLKFLGDLMRPRFTRYPPRAIRIPRPKQSVYKEPISAWLYFDGPVSALKRQTKIVLDIPGGGFVSMSPRTYDDKLIAWAGKMGIAVLSLDYRKAPEYPYPYALNECYDVYHTLITSRGRCVGMSGDDVPRVIVSGDSAGGNLAAGMVLMILQAASTDTRRLLGEKVLPPPEGVVLVYPALDVNVGNWMTDEQMSLIRDRRSRQTNQSILKRKSSEYRKLAPDTPAPSDDEDDGPETDLEMKPANKIEDAGIKESETAIHLPAARTNTDTQAKPPADQSIELDRTIKTSTGEIQAQPNRILRTRVATPSLLSYFNDRILTPEMLRAMIILYIGPHNRPSFSTDYLLSPVLAPETLLRHFPPLRILTGERDPLVDDTVIFAGRVRQARRVWGRERRELGLTALASSSQLTNGVRRGRPPPTKPDMGSEADRHVRVTLIPGISHGFLNFVGVFPEGWKFVHRCAHWMEELFAENDREMWARESEAGPCSTTAYPHHFVNGDGMVTVTPGPAMGEEADMQSGYFDSPEERDRRHHRRKKTESEGEDDLPLEMSFVRRPGSTAPQEEPRKANGVPNGVGKSIQERQKDANRRRGGDDSLGRNKRRSLVSLASEEDLLGRRMKGLTGGLLGGQDDMPPTP